MKKYKKIIIIFNLILSILFINFNITSTYCDDGMTFYLFLNSNDDFLHSPFVSIGNGDKVSMVYVSRLSQGKFLYFYMSDSPVNINAGDNIYIWDGDEVLYYYTVNDLSGDANVYNFYFSDFLDYNNSEETETTETTEETENTEENNNNIVVDNTEVLAELKEIKSYLLMFFATYFLISGYKIIKETARKEKKL